MFHIKRTLFFIMLAVCNHMHPSTDSPPSAVSAYDLLHDNKYRLNRAESPWNIGGFNLLDSDNRTIDLVNEANTTPERLLALKGLFVAQHSNKLKEIDTLKIAAYMNQLSDCIERTASQHTKDSLDYRWRQMEAVMSIIIAAQG